MYAFVALGLPDGMIGTAWPAIRRSFHSPLDDIGIVLLAGSVGSVATAAIAGLVVGRVGTRVTIMAAAALTGTGAVVAVASPTFSVLVAAAALVGMAAGLLDSSVNIAAAASGRNRLLNLLHGCYGVGTTVAPLLVTVALLTASSWRPAYAVLLVVDLGLFAGWWWVGRPSRLAPTPPMVAAPVTGTAGLAAVGPVPPTAGPRGGRLALAVGLGLFVFLMYTGMEVAAGQWEPSYDRSALHMATGVTGVAVFGYWGALTLVRLLLAVPRRPPSPQAIVRWGCVVACVGAVIVWWGPATPVTLVGFVIIGGALAGVFPALVSLTPARVGDGTAKHVIGWQIGAAGIGGSVISAVLGLVFQHFGFRWLGPCLVLLGIVLLGGVEALARVGPAPAPPSAPPVPALAAG